MDQTTIWTNNLKARSEPGLCPDFITVCNEITLKKRNFIKVRLVMLTKKPRRQRESTKDLLFSYGIFHLLSYW